MPSFKRTSSCPRIASLLLSALLLAGTAPLTVLAEPIRKPTVTKPTVKKPGVGTVAPKAPAKPTVSKPRSKAPVVAGAAAGAAALALGTSVAPALPASAPPEQRELEAKAREGDVDAQMGLAEALTSQTPTNPQDIRRAVYWYGQAAAKGDADACWTLAELFRGDLGIPEDMEQAAAWYTKAAQLGHAEAAFDLGLLYTEGDGVERHTGLAARWFELAADAGIARALFMLGTLYEQGVDGAPDLDAARAWYRRAQDSGDAAAGQALRRLDAGGRNVEVAEGPPAGMLGGPPGSAVARRSKAQAAGQLSNDDDDDDADEGETVRQAGAAAPVVSGAAAGARQSPAAPVPVDQAGVREIQARLIKLGLHRGKPDGFLGKRTVAAIRAYQKSVGLPVDGKASQALLKRLRQG